MDIKVESSFDFSNFYISNNEEMKEFLNCNTILESIDLENNITKYVKLIDGAITNQFYIVDNYSHAVYKSKLADEKIPQVKSSIQSLRNLKPLFEHSVVDK